MSTKFQGVYTPSRGVNKSLLQVREKELHTVYIDDADSVAAAHKSTRNVGILCKAAMRDVAVMYHCDAAAPMTHNIAVGVGEVGVSGDC